MSRTERNHLRYDSDTDQVRLNPNGRDDKCRCYCCGNTWQKIYNRRERKLAKKAITDGVDPQRVRADWN